MRSIERVIFATATNASALGLNILLNAVFIFGLFGLPQMGIVGVAMATTIARGVELAICLLDACRFKTIRFRPKTIIERHRLLFRILSATLCRPSEMKFPGCGLLHVLSHHGAPGKRHGCRQCSGHCSQKPGHSGMLWACQCRRYPSRQIHRGRIHGHGKGGFHTVLQDHIFKRNCGRIIIFLLRPLFMNMADLTPTAQSYLSTMLYINMYYVLGQAMNTTVICGIFRSGGDSRWGFLCDCIDMWLFAVPLGFISAFLLKLPPMWVYFLICLDEFVKMPFIYKHYKSYKWLQNITRDF